MVRELGTVSPSQAWAVLSRHARDEIRSLRLQELCRDNDRVSSLVIVNNNTDRDNLLIADLSRQLMNDTTLNHLLHLAACLGLKQYIKHMAWSRNDFDRSVGSTTNKRSESQSATSFDLDRPAFPSMHMALRVPNGKGYEMFDENRTNVLTAIHREWDSIEALSESIRQGKHRGATGQMLRDVVVVGQGVAVAALQFLYTALQNDEAAVSGSKAGLSIIGSNLSQEQPGSARMRLATLTGVRLDGRSMKFITSVDPLQMAAVTSDLEPATTLVISIAVNGNEETGVVTRALKSWLLQNMKHKTENVLTRHMMLVTGNERIASVIPKPECVHRLPEHSRCEAFLSCSVASILPLSIVFGWPVVSEILAGAHDMDLHFVDKNPRHNLPVLLALMDVWNDIFLNTSSRIVTPYSDAFGDFPAFVRCLEAQMCANIPTNESFGRSLEIPCSSYVIDGGRDGALDKSLYLSDAIMNSELVMSLDSQLRFVAARVGSKEDVFSAQDSLMCSLFAHADELAFGTSRTAESLPSPLASPSASKAISDSNDGNRPSMLLMCGKLDAFCCGQLLALSEHRAAVKAFVRGIDPFDHATGPSIRMERTEELKNEFKRMMASTDDDSTTLGDQRLPLATRTLLNHYASMMKNERLYTVSKQ